jgi:hypothetical protein
MSDINQTFCFLLLSICLGGCFIWAIWEIEAASQRRRQRTKLVHEARGTVLTGAKRVWTATYSRRGNRADVDRRFHV